MNVSIGNPLSVLTDGMRGDPWTTPSFAPGSEVPEYDHDEFVVHAVYGGSVSLEISGTADRGWTEVWSPPRHASVVVTDRRVVIGCREFDRGSTYWGTGMGAVVAVGATAVSRARARGRTAGHCLAMQWRHAWVSAVGYLAGGGGWQSGLARLAGVPTEQIAVIADEPGMQWRLRFGSPGEPAVPQRATAVATAIVRARLTAPDELAAPERAALRRLESTGTPLRGDRGESAAVQIPGARAVGWRPGAATTTAICAPVAAAAPAPPTSRRPAVHYCGYERCDAYDLPTPLERCDVCGLATRSARPSVADLPGAVRVTMTPPEPRPAAGGRPMCVADSCDAYGLPTPLSRCDLCGRPTAVTG
jgi:hypothetical protein